MWGVGKLMESIAVHRVCSKMIFWAEARLLDQSSLCVLLLSMFLHGWHVLANSFPWACNHGNNFRWQPYYGGKYYVGTGLSHIKLTKWVFQWHFCSKSVFEKNCSHQQTDDKNMHVKCRSSITWLFMDTCSKIYFSWSYATSSQDRTSPKWKNRLSVLCTSFCAINSHLNIYTRLFTSLYHWTVLPLFPGNISSKISSGCLNCTNSLENGTKTMKRINAEAEPITVKDQSWAMYSKECRIEMKETYRQMDKEVGRWIRM